MKIKTKRYYIYYIALIGGGLLSILPIRLVSRLAGVIGRIVYMFTAKEKNIALDNLRQAFKEKNDDELRKIAKESVSSVFRSFGEFVSMYKINKSNVDRWVTVHGLENVHKALEHKKGMIALTGHLGNWEFISASMRIRGYKGGVIARKVYFHRYDDLLLKLRRVHDVYTIYRDDSPKKILRLLKDNGVLGMLADQDIDSVESVFVNFFGRPTYTPVAPVKIAMATGAPIVPCYIIRNKNLRYDLYFEEPFFVEKKEDSRDEAVKFYTQKWTDILESYIRKYPGQWVWMHKRWKTQPGSVKT